MPFFGIVPTFLEVPYIKFTYEAAAPDRSFMNGLFADAGRYAHMPIPDGIRPSVATVVRGAGGAGGLVVVVSEAKQREETEKAWIALRAARREKLAAIDYRFLSDYPMGEEERERWRAYRQALRDLPGQTADPLAPVWPEEPSA